MERQNFPSGIRNDLDRLWEDEGGPAQIDGVDRDRFEFGSACDSFPYSDIAPLLRAYQSDEKSCRSHWPWVAMIADLYTFEARELKSYDELGPKGVQKIFENISDAAGALAKELERLHVHSYRLDDPKKPEARGHLAYLHELFKQQAIGDIDADLVDDVLVQMGTDRLYASLVSRLAKVRMVARDFAKDRIEGRMLKRTRGQTDPALHNLVSRAGQIWKSHTGRVPSANKVHKRDDDRSDFVRFVQAVVALTGNTLPSRGAVQTALK